MDCLSASLIALKLVGITLHTIPAIAVQHDISHRGYYTRLGTQPVIVLKDVNDCYALTHELIHEKQAEVYGWDENMDRRQYWKLEMDAAHLTAQAAMEYMSEYGRHLNDAPLK